MPTESNVHKQAAAVKLLGGLQQAGGSRAQQCMAVHQPPLTLTVVDSVRKEVGHREQQPLRAYRRRRRAAGASRLVTREGA